MRLPVLCLLALSACHAEKKPPPPASIELEPRGSPEFQRIAALEDRRSFDEGRLPIWALTHRDPAVRARALLALGRIQDPESLDVVLKGLTDPDLHAREEAAFAAGLLGMSWQKLTDVQRTKLTDGLKKFEATETAPSVKLALIDALARAGTLAAAERLVDRLSVAGEVQARAALGLGVEVRQMAPAPLPTRAYGLLSGLVKKELPPATRYGAAYALAASKNALAHGGLLPGLQDDVSEIRAICAKGLGDLGSDADSLLLQKLLDDPDYRVVVEATRALAKLATRCKGTCAAIAALWDLNFRVVRLVRGDTAGGGQPLLALAQQGLPAEGQVLLASLRYRLSAELRGLKDVQIKKDVANIECRLAAALDRISGEVSEVLSCGDGLIPEGQRLAMGLRAVGELPAKDPLKRLEDLSKYLSHPEPRVQLAAIEVLGDNKALPAALKLRPMLGAADYVLVAAAATALAKLGDKAAIPAIRLVAPLVKQLTELAAPLAEAFELLDAKEAIPDLEAWLALPHVAVRIAAAEALAKLGKPVAPTWIERPAEPPPAAELPKDAVLKVQTERGTFDVKLYTHDAPLTALNLYTLAKSGFFKDVTFHRIVPDFVAQGGDPRGDGEGGPGYTIRCEVNHRPYLRGVVGMALGGKDTGGSQFFVTLAPTPHLDGKYTSFGEVVNGQEVVDALLEGDKILQVTPAQ